MANGYQWMCKTCFRRFTTKGNRKRHIAEMHDNIKIYKCDIENCGKQFTRDRGLQNHKRKYHSGLRLFCSFCNKGFFSSDALRIHCSKMHRLSDDYQYICNKCNRICNDKWHHKKHTASCGSTKQRRKAGTSKNSTKTIKYKRSMINAIQRKIDIDKVTEETAIKIVSVEHGIYLTKLKSWWSLRNAYVGLAGTRRNVSGAGRPLPETKQNIFNKAYEIFKYERYELRLPFNNADLGDLLVRSAYDLDYNDYAGIENNTILWHDIQLFKKHFSINIYAISSKKKYNDEYLIAILGSWFKRVLKQMHDDKIKLDDVIFCDETSVRCDFCMADKTASVSKQNSPVVSVENNKETITNCIFWNMEQLRHFMFIFGCIIVCISIFY